MDGGRRGVNGNSLHTSKDVRLNKLAYINNNNNKKYNRFNIPPHSHYISHGLHLFRYFGVGYLDNAHMTCLTI